MRESSRAIDEAASRWAVRLDRGLTDAEQASLDAWLSGDIRRTGALARAQAAWVYVDRAQVLRLAPELRESRTQRRWRVASPWARAAVVLLGALTTLLVWRGYTQTHLATAVGEVRRAPLADGSHVTLDTRSRIAVRYEPDTRLVVLESGEALFEVAKNAKRPFVVQAGNVRVRAVGTAFVVRRRSDDDVDVTVTQGVVDVWRETNSPEPAVRLRAGSHASATPTEITAPSELSPVKLLEAVAWTSGVIDLNGQTLGEAAAEFNRYNRQIVVISDARLAAQTVVGRFEATNPRAFVTSAAAMLDARERTDGDKLILEPRPPGQK
jgi:transmembrane sensor